MQLLTERSGWKLDHGKSFGNSSPLLYKRATLGLGTLVYWGLPLMVMMMMMICNSTSVVITCLKSLAHYSTVNFLG